MGMINNIDTLEVSFDISHYEDVPFLHRLETEKGYAKSAQNDYFVEVMGLTWKLMPAGTRFHSIILKNDDLEIHLARFRSKNMDNYPVKVIFRSSYLWATGFKNCYEQIHTFITNNLGEVCSEKVTRVDLCLHTDEYQFSLSDLELFCKRSKNVHNHTPQEDEFSPCYPTDSHLFGHSFTGFTFGSGALMCRIYNKSLEVSKSRKEWFHQIWLDNDLWLNGVWNIEFQLRREFLRELQIDTCQQLFSCLDSLWQYLTNKWLCLKNKDNKNISRCTINDFWLKVIFAFGKFNGSAVVRKSRQFASSAMSLIPSLTGYISSFVSCCMAKLNFKDFESAVWYCIDECASYLDFRNQNFATIVKDKLAVRQGVMSA